MRLVAGFVSALLLCLASFGQAIHGRDGITLPNPPAVEAVPVIDDYFGTQITDSYRWLEDAKSTQTRAFIEAQNAYTTRYMKQAPIRNQALDDLDALEHVSRWSIPMQRAGNLYFMRRMADEEQASIYVRRTGNGQPALGPASKTSASSTPHPSAATPTPPSASQMSRATACSLPTMSAREAQTNPPSASTTSRRQDARGRTPGSHPLLRHFHTQMAQASITRATTAKEPCSTSTPSARETRTISSSSAANSTAKNSAPSISFRPTITDDGHYLVITIERGVPAKRVDIAFRDLTKPNSMFEVLVWGLDSRFSTIYANRAWYIRTDYSSPMAASSSPIPASCPRPGRQSSPRAKTSSRTSPSSATKSMSSASTM